MQSRQLGKGGPEVSAIGLGAWPIGGGLGHVEEGKGIAIVRAAIDNGITLVDTAQGYRTSEETLGKALKDGYRERCFLATKVSGNYSRGGIEQAIEDSLRKLDVDYVDLYQIHGWNPEYPIEESMAAMAQLQEQGKARFIGVSNFNAIQMEQAYATSPFHSNQPRYHMLDRGIEPEDIPCCERMGIGILAHSTLGKGLLTGRYRAGHQFPEDDERSGFPRFQGETFARYCVLAEGLGEVAGDKGVSLVQLAIAWVLRLPTMTCALVGAKSVSQVEEHVAEVTLTEDELERIEAILAEVPAYES
jgi:aryl-alcohol dehydrogenase-like predicted oxidoreductase